MKASQYKMHKKSKFYINNYDNGLINLIFDDAIATVSTCMLEHGLILSEFILGRHTRMKLDFFSLTPWMNHTELLGSNQTFHNVIFFDKEFEYDYSTDTFYDPQGIERSGKITGGQDNPSTSYYFHNSEFIAYIVKCIEQVCREKVDYKYSLRPSYNRVYGTIRLNHLVNSGKIMNVVRKTVTDYIEKNHWKFI